MTPEVDQTDVVPGADSKLIWHGITYLPQFSGKKAGLRARLSYGAAAARANRGRQQIVGCYPQPADRLPTYDFKLYVDVAARGVRIGADLFVRFLGEGRQFGLRQAFVLDV